MSLLHYLHINFSACRWENCSLQKVGDDVYTPEYRWRVCHLHDSRCQLVSLLTRSVSSMHCWLSLMLSKGLFVCCWLTVVADSFVCFSLLCLSCDIVCNGWHRRHASFVHSIIPNSHRQARPNKTVLCLGSVNWIFNDSRLLPTENLKSEHAQSKCPIYTVHQMRHRCCSVVAYGVAVWIQSAITPDCHWQKIRRLDMLDLLYVAAVR